MSIRCRRLVLLLTLLFTVSASASCPSHLSRRGFVASLAAAAAAGVGLWEGIPWGWDAWNEWMAEERRRAAEDFASQDALALQPRFPVRAATPREWNGQAYVPTIAELSGHHNAYWDAFAVPSRRPTYFRLSASDGARSHTGNVGYVQWRPDTSGGGFTLDLYNAYEEWLATSRVRPVGSGWEMVATDLAGRPLLTVRRDGILSVFHGPSATPFRETLSPPGGGESRIVGVDSRPAGEITWYPTGRNRSEGRILYLGGLRPRDGTDPRAIMLYVAFETALFARPGEEF